MFKDFVVMTREHDRDTQAVCMKHNVSCNVFVPSAQTLRTKFNKSAMVKQLQELVHRAHRDKWILLMDADVVLPDDFESIVDESRHSLDERALYGLRRYDYSSPDDFEARRGGKLYPYNFMGYFQMYFDKNKYYIKNSETTAVCDVYFCNLFPKRIFLSTTSYIHHMGSERINHEGRISPLWVPTHKPLTAKSAEAPSVTVEHNDVEEPVEAPATTSLPSVEPEDVVKDVKEPVEAPATTSLPSVEPEDVVKDVKEPVEAPATTSLPSVEPEDVVKDVKEPVEAPATTSLPSVEAE
jgi:hypothetical protein